MTALEMDEVVWFEQRDFGELQEYSKQQGQARTDATRLEMAGITPRAVFDWMNRRAALPYVDDFSSFFNLQCPFWDKSQTSVWTSRTTRNVPLRLAAE